MNDAPIGYTHEGYPVTAPAFPLTFCPLSVGFSDFPQATLSIALEFNQTADKKKKPYLAIHLFGILIQSGWLF